MAWGKWRRGGGMQSVVEFFSKYGNLRYDGSVSRPTTTLYRGGSAAVSVRLPAWLNGFAIRFFVLAIGFVAGFAILQFAQTNNDASNNPGDAPPRPVRVQEVDNAPENELADVLVPPIDLPFDFVPPAYLQQELEIEDIVANLLIAGENRVNYVNLAGDAFDHDDRAVFHPHGEEICASGCAASRHPTETLTDEEYLRLIDEFADQPINETSKAYEALLYYGRQTREMMNRHGVGSLDGVRVSALQNELKRTHAFVQLRVIDEAGEVRSWLPSTRVPFDRRHVFDMEVNAVQPLITSGTVKRVGLYHLWTRL